MRKVYMLILSAFSCTTLAAQTPEDALRSSWHSAFGSARSMAVGGAIGALGGDISSNHINPAGLGMYRTREIVITPAYLWNTNDIKYRDSLNTNRKQAFNYGTIGVVFGAGYTGTTVKSEAVSITLTQMSSFNDRQTYKGYNNFSSFSEQYLEELTRDRADTNAALSNYIFGSSLAFWTYLIDTLNNAAGIFSGYKSLVPLAGSNNPADGIMQYRDAKTRGGIHELAVGYGANTNDKLYIGASFNIPIISYRRDLFYKESDATANTNNNFNYFEYTETAKSTGVGIGLRLGAIYKPVEHLRVGLAFHTPQLVYFSDQIRSAMTTDTEGYAGKVSKSSDELNSGNAGKRKYRQITPWRAIASFAYVFREIDDTKKQRAFVSADIEYVNYRGARYYTLDEEDVSGREYYKSVNAATKDYYKGNFNFKLGGELKFDPVMFRVGAAFYGSPYKAKQFDANRTILSGGIGFRKYGFFLDLTYMHTINKDVSFPYRLNDVANTFATVTSTKGIAVVTLGIKF